MIRLHTSAEILLSGLPVQAASSPSGLAAAGPAKKPKSPKTPKTPKTAPKTAPKSPKTPADKAEETQEPQVEEMPQEDVTQLSDDDVAEKVPVDLRKAVADEASKKQPKTEAKAKGKAKAKEKKLRVDKDSTPAEEPMKKPAASKGLKRPASKQEEGKAIKAYKCMYKDGSWGIKCHGSQQCSVWDFVAFVFFALGWDFTATVFPFLLDFTRSGVVISWHRRRWRKLPRQAQHDVFQRQPV